MMSGFFLRTAAIYDDSDLMKGMKIAKETLRKARRSGRLRWTRAGHRILYRGKWVIDWLETPLPEVTAKNATRPA